jgi:sulfate permease, SulP family
MLTDVGIVEKPSLICEIHVKSEEYATKAPSKRIEKLKNRAVLSSLRFDLPAGIIVALVALPLALGFGITSGAGAASGLVAAIVAGLVAGLLGGSNYQVTGPTGAMVVILFPIIAEVGLSGLLAVGIVAGALIVLMGLLRLGKLAHLIPNSVMEGFTLGIALVIALQQLPLVLGVEKGEGTESLEVALNTIENAQSQGVSLFALLMVALTIAMKTSWAKLSQKATKLRAVPPSAVAVLLLTVATVLFQIPVATVGALPGLDMFKIDLTWPNLPLGTLMYAAIVVALLAAIESLLSARVADAMVHRRDGEIKQGFKPDRELIGQGFATMASSLFGGMPATGAIARTAVNVNSGAKTRLSSITHALVLLIFVAALGPLVSEIPMPVLAGVLLGASWRIASPRSIVENLTTTWPERIGYLSTAVMVLAIDLIWGLAIGILVHQVALKLGKWSSSYRLRR